MSSLLIAGPALCAWRENRNHGIPGLQSIINVLHNRAMRDKTSMYHEATERLQFSSMTARGDSGTISWPTDNDPLIPVIEDMINRANAGTLPDITNGATLYYAPNAIITDKTYTLPDGSKVFFPKDWNPAAVKFEARIGDQLFFHEV